MSIFALNISQTHTILLGHETANQQLTFFDFHYERRIFFAIQTVQHSQTKQISYNQSSNKRNS